MTMETETASPIAGRNVRDYSDATITRASETSESNSINRGKGGGRGGRTGRVSHQGRGRRGGRFNRPAYTLSIEKFKEKWRILARF